MMIEDSSGLSVKAKDGSYLTLTYQNENTLVFMML